MSSIWHIRVECRHDRQSSTESETREKEPTITVDSLKVAQFIYLLLNNHEVRNAIDTITSKVVLILGRFTPERKAILDGLREELRRLDYLPVMFDFDVPQSRDTDETVGLLARMARFVIADLSDARSVLQELRGIVSDLPSVPVQPIIWLHGADPGMFDHFRRYPWVLQPIRYATTNDIISSLIEKRIDKLYAGRPG